MRNALVMAVGLALAVTACSDRLSQMQDKCNGTWTLESREMADGTRMTPPAVWGIIEWEPIDARKAHVTVTMVQDNAGEQIIDYAASTYEISTSAITRKRHALVQRGYRDREGSPLSHYIRGKTEKGKASIENGTITFHHAAKDAAGGALPGDEGYTQVYEGETMTAAYSGKFTDTWRRVR